MDLREIAAAYQSIYLSEEVEEEGVKQIVFEDLSQEEVDNFVEEIVDELFEEGFSIEDIEEAFNDYIDEECSFLTEARAAKRQPLEFISYSIKSGLRNPIFFRLPVLSRS